MDNQSLVRLLQGDPQSRETALRSIYLDESLRAQTRSILRSLGAEPDSLDDIFTETLVHFDRSIRLNRFEGRSHWHTWFVAIAKWSFLARQKRDKQLTFNNLEDETHPTVHSPEDIFIQTERRELLEKTLAEMGEKCRALLEMTRLKRSMDEIAAARSYANANVAKKEVSLCKSRLRQLLQQNPAFQELLAHI